MKIIPPVGEWGFLAFYYSTPPWFFHRYFEKTALFRRKKSREKFFEKSRKNR